MVLMVFRQVSCDGVNDREDYESDSCVSKHVSDDQITLKVVI